MSGIFKIPRWSSAVVAVSAIVMVVILNIWLVVNSHLNIIFGVLFLWVFVEIVVDDVLFKEVVLGASERNEPVTLESIATAATFTF